MSKKILATNKDGTVQVVLVDSTNVEECCQVMVHYLHTEILAKTIGVYENPKAEEEILGYLRAVADQGISTAVIHKDSGKVVGVSLCLIRDSNTDEWYKQLISLCKESESRKFLEVERSFDREYDVLKETGSQCVIEFLYTEVIPEFRSQGIALIMCQIMINLGRELASGRFRRKKLDGTLHSMHPLPEGIFAVCSNITSVRILSYCGVPQVKSVEFKGIGSSVTFHFMHLSKKLSSL